jgi:tetratricopeptide (TPR) repeat protein
MNKESILGLIQKAYDKLKASDAESALMALEEAQKIDPEDAEVVFALKCLNWWLDKIGQLERFPEAYEKGGFILSQWKSFYSFLDRLGTIYDTCLYALRCFIFSRALASFEDLLGDGVNEHDPELLLQVGRCFKGVGDYESAIRYLEQAGRFKREDGEVLSELADVNALLEETRIAKALFREAFFLDPQSIDLREMESELIVRLRDRVKELGYSGPDLPEWIPIYGNLFGVFTVKRVLKQVEIGRLKQSIFSMENELRSQSRNEKLLKPRLLNRYFWLIDHYEHIQEDASLIKETMIKIKQLDPAIYNRYCN